MPAGYVHCLFESIPGNEVNSPTPSTKIIYLPVKSAGGTLGPDPLERDDEVRNQSDALAVAPALYAPEGQISVPAYPDTLGWMLTWILGRPTSTTSSGATTDPDSATIPSGATKHVWTSNALGPAGSSPLTAQMQLVYKDQSWYCKAKGLACTGLEFSLGDKEVMLAATLQGLYMDTAAADPALTPAYEALTILPFKRTNVKVATWLASSDAQYEDISFRLQKDVERVYSMGVSTKFLDVMDKGSGPTILSGDVTLRHVKSADVAAALANTGFATKTLFTSDSIAVSAYPYKLWIETSNTQLLDVDPDDLQNKVRHGAKYPWKATNAGSAAFTITLVNMTANYN